MRVRNLVTGTSPGVLHRNGNPPNWRTEWQHVVKAFFSEARTSDPPCPKVTVLTWNSRPAKALLELCLDARGVPYVTLGRNLPSWRNCYKLYLTADALSRVTTPYVMALDADDVLAVSPLHEILRTYQSFECDIVIGSEKQSWPNVESLARFERSIAESDYSYLNSGAWIGKTQACREFFQLCLDADIGDVMNAKQNMTMLYDDQGLTRLAFRRYHPRVRLDYQCRIFQSLFRVPVSGEVVIQSDETTDGAGIADGRPGVATEC
jgi:hypothetical protein